MALAQKTKVKSGEQAFPTIALLNQLLANAIDLKLSAKQAHWNVRGENFAALHALFDTVSTEADGYVDLLAERAVQLDGIAEGTLQTVADQSILPAYPTDARRSADHVRALSTALGVLADAHRQAINTAAEAGDMVTSDLCTEITRGLDKLHWMVRSHL